MNNTKLFCLEDDFFVSLHNVEQTKRLKVTLRFHEKESDQRVREHVSLQLRVKDLVAQTLNVYNVTQFADVQDAVQLLARKIDKNTLKPLDDPIVIALNGEDIANSTLQNVLNRSAFVNVAQRADSELGVADQGFDIDVPKTILHSPLLFVDRYNPPGRRTRPGAAAEAHTFEYKMYSLERLYDGKVLLMTSNGNQFIRVNFAFQNNDTKSERRTLPSSVFDQAFVLAEEAHEPIVFTSFKARINPVQRGMYPLPGIAYDMPWFEWVLPKNMNNAAVGASFPRFGFFPWKGQIWTAIIDGLDLKEIEQLNSTADFEFKTLKAPTKDAIAMQSDYRRAYQALKGFENNYITIELTNRNRAAALQRSRVRTKPLRM